MKVRAEGITVLASRIKARLEYPELLRGQINLKTRVPLKAGLRGAIWGRQNATGLCPPIWICIRDLSP